MGRGRAKAKQQKVARKLKYSSPDTDLTALQRELSGSTGQPSQGQGSAESEDEQGEDRYGDDDGEDDRRVS